MNTTTTTTKRTRTTRRTRTRHRRANNTLLVERGGKQVRVRKVDPSERGNPHVRETKPYHQRYAETTADLAVGGYLKSERLLLRIRRRPVAEAMDISESHLCNLEHGKAHWSDGLIESYAFALDMCDAPHREIAPTWHRKNC